MRSQIVQHHPQRAATDGTHSCNRSPAEHTAFLAEGFKKCALPISVFADGCYTFLVPALGIGDHPSFQVLHCFTLLRVGALGFSSGPVSHLLPDIVQPALVLRSCHPYPSRPAPPRVPCGQRAGRAVAAVGLSSAAETGMALTSSKGSAKCGEAVSKYFTA